MSFLLRSVQKRIGSIFGHGGDGDENSSGNSKNVVDGGDNIGKQKGGDMVVIAAVSCLPERDTELFTKLKELEYCYFGTLEQYDEYNLWLRNTLSRRDRCLNESLNERGRIYETRIDCRGGYWKDTSVLHCMYHGSHEHERETSIVATKTTKYGGRSRNINFSQWQVGESQEKETILRDDDVRRQIRSGRKYYYKLTPCQQCQRLKELLDDKETELLFSSHKFKLAFIDGMNDKGSITRLLLDQENVENSFRLKQRIADFVGVPYTYNDYGAENISEYQTIYLQSKVTRRVRLQGAI